MWNPNVTYFQSSGSLVPPSKDPVGLQWVEFFAGRGEATRSFQCGGFRAARLDLIYMRPKNPNEMNPMDLTSDAGMAILGW